LVRKNTLLSIIKSVFKNEKQERKITSPRSVSEATSSTLYYLICPASNNNKKHEAYKEPGETKQCFGNGMKKNKKT
jgi:hypothetical protein